ncbi:MAG: hypothetical protein ACRC5M_00705 [Anaeroplasmataceae bacterium]
MTTRIQYKLELNEKRDYVKNIIEKNMEIVKCEIQKRYSDNIELNYNHTDISHNEDKTKWVVGFYDEDILVYIKDDKVVQVSSVYEFHECKVMFNNIAIAVGHDDVVVYNYDSDEFDEIGA